MIASLFLLVGLTNLCAGSPTTHIKLEFCAEDDNSSSPQWVNYGGFLLLFLGSGVCFWALAHVCDHYFCTSLRVMCEEWKIPDDVAGATFMAIGTSAADLIIAILALFVSKSTLGLGTIIGSELFNHLVICAGSILASPSGELKIEPRAFTRDCIFYMVSLLALIWLLGEAKMEKSDWEQCLSVPWYKGFILLLFYVIYILCAIYFSTWLLWLTRAQNAAKSVFGISNKSHHPKKTTAMDTTLLLSSESPTSTGSSETGDKSNTDNDMSTKQQFEEIHQAAVDRSRAELDAMQEHAHKEIVANTSGKKLTFVSERTSHNIKAVFRYLVLPVHTLLYYTIPDVTVAQYRKYYFYVMFISIVYLGVIAEALILQIEALGAWMTMRQTLMGITISAAGASMPTLWSSVVVARQGYGDMAISNALGANTFSILVGVGLPYFLYPLYLKKPYKGVEDGGIMPLLLMLLFILIFFYILIWKHGFVMKKWMSYLFLVSYVVIIILICIIELAIYRPTKQVFYANGTAVNN